MRMNDRTLSMNLCSVAQVANLPYRRLPIGDALEIRTAGGLASRDTAQRGYATGRPSRFCV